MSLLTVKNDPIAFRLPRIVLAVVFLLLAAGPGEAQRLLGIVRDSATLQPVVGATVTALNEREVATVRALTGPAGEFAIIRVSGTSTLRVTRIGFRPVTITFPTAATSVNILLTPLSWKLNGMRVAAEELCPKSADRAHAFQLWTQARAALLSASTSESANAKISYLLYSREVRVGTAVIIRQKVDALVLPASRSAFGSPSPEALAADGYIREVEPGPLAGISRVYYLPDALSLADDTFAATHCFDLVQDGHARPNEVGIAFSPLPGREVVDIGGVLWIDLIRQEVRSVVFRYTKLEPALAIAGAGGELHFRTLANDVTFIERWAVRLPQPALRPGSSYRNCAIGGQDLSKSCAGGGGNTVPVPVQVTAAGRREDQGDLTVTSVVEKGGAVTSIHSNDGVTWSAPASGLTGTVIRAGNRSPASFAVAVPAAGSDTVVAEATGRFQIIPLPAGRYRMTFADTSDGRCSVVEQDINVGVGELVTAQVEVPRRTRFPWRACKIKR